MVNETVLNTGFKGKKLPASNCDYPVKRDTNIKEGLPYPTTNDIEPVSVQSLGINEILNELNISKEEINLQILKELMESGVYLPRETIQSIVSIHSRYGIDGIKAAFMLIFEGEKQPDSNVIEKMILIDKGSLKLDALLKSLEETIKDRDNNTAPIMLSQLKKAFLQPEETYKNMFKPGFKPDNIYKELLNNMHSIKKSAFELFEDADEFIEKTVMFERSIHFLKDVAQYIPYYQVPIRLKEYYTTGELYIMKRRKAPKNKAAFTILLSLSTENIGKVDTLLEFYGRNVRISIRVNDEKVSECINDYKDKVFEVFNNINFTVVEMQCFAGERISLLDTLDFVGRISDTRRIIDCYV